MDSQFLAEIAAEACDDRKAKDIQLIQIEMVSSLTDWIIVAEGLSDVNVRAIAKSVEENLEEKANRRPLRREGVNEAKWVLLDYGEIIINVLQGPERKFYNLEAFWSHGKKHIYCSSNKQRSENGIVQ